MSDEENLPDTLTASTTIISDNNGATLAPIWGRLERRRCFLSSIELRNDVYKLGRSPSCDISLDLVTIPGAILKLTSKEHFYLSKDRTNVPYVKDVSKNGTYLNGALIGRDNMAALRDGDIIAIGAKPHELYQFKEERVNSICKEFDSKYVITRLLGKGAFGEVFLAVAKREALRYAVKKIATQGRDENKVMNEIRIMNRVSHPCIVEMIEAIRTSQHVYLILEYMEGGELQSRVLQKGKLKESTAKLYIYQIGIGVEYLHKCGISHRDLKPENVLLKTRNSTTILKITDFGMSKIVGRSAAMQSLCGTPLYVAPEILKIEGTTATYSPQVDVWSLGCITFFTLMGRTPFQTDGDFHDPQNSQSSQDIQDSQEDSLQHLYQKIIKGDYKIPVTKIRTKDNRLVEQYVVSDNAVELIKLMLHTDPRVRLTIDEMLVHDWFQDAGLKRKIEELFETSNISLDY